MFIFLKHQQCYCRLSDASGTQADINYNSWRMVGVTKNSNSFESGFISISNKKLATSHTFIKAKKNCIKKYKNCKIWRTTFYLLTTLCPFQA